MILRLFLMLATCSQSFTLQSTNDELPLTGISKKSTARQYIHFESQSWEDLLRLSGLIVDKSLLLRAILNRNDTLVQICCPRKFGKTMNLQMMGAFLHIEVDEKGDAVAPENTRSYKFFVKGEYVGKDQTSQIFTPAPMISNDSGIVENYLGKYPVININFKGVSGNSYKDVMDSIAVKIQAAFVEHSYLLKTLQKGMDGVPERQKQAARNDYQFFNRLSAQTAGPEDLVVSLVFLSRLLHERFDQRVFILFDDYDRVLKSMLLDKTYDPQEVQKVVAFLKLFFGSTFTPSNGHLYKAILTGVYLFSNEDIFANLPLAKYYYLRDLIPFYGFVKSEVDAVFDCTNVAKELRHKAHDYYDGYKGGANFEISIYNPLSIVSFANEKALKSFWTLSENVLGMLLKYALKDDNFAIFFTDIINLRAAKVTVMQLTVENFEPLRPIMFNVTDNVLQHANTILWYLYINGYFTVRNMVRGYDNEIKLDLLIPNKEIVEELSLALIRLYYLEKHKISHTAFEAALEYLGGIMNRDEHMLILLVKTFDAIISRVVRVNGIMSFRIETDEQRCIVNSTLNFLALRIPQKFDFKIEPTDRSNGKEPDIIMYNDKRIVVIQIHLDALKPNYALVNAKRYKSVVRAKKNLQGIGEMKFIGIGVSPARTIFTRCELQKIDIWH